MQVFDPFEYALQALRDRLSKLDIAWMIFGGSAMRLHGLDSAPVADIDVVVRASDAAAIETALGWVNVADGGTGRFRSEYVFKPRLGQVDVEILGGFEICAQGAWNAVLPDGVVKIVTEQGALPVASKQRLIELFEMCGRDKDLRRAEMISRALEGGGPA